MTSTLTSISGSTCATPISIPITEVEFSNGASARGLKVSLGSPGQPLAIMPAWGMNNTYIFDKEGQCASDYSLAYCTSYRGGLFDEGSSSSYTKSTNLVSSGADPTDVFGNSSQSQDTVWCTDGFNLTQNISLSPYPFGIMRSDISGPYHSQHVLGLGTNSTLLSALKSAGQIASRSWSMFWGLTGTTSTTQMDGVFVIGGYDSAKTTGLNYTAPLRPDENCKSGMLVTISDIELSYPNGTSSSIFGESASAALSACIMPDYPVLMTLPLSPYYETFESITGLAEYSIDDHSYGINFYGQTYPNAKELDFDMTIHLTSGLQVTIENSQLITPDRTISAQNGSIERDDSVQEVSIIALQGINSNDIVKLGRQFLSGAYVLLNQDSGTYTMWRAVTTNEQKLVAVDAKGNVDPAACMTRGEADSAATSKVNQTSSDSPQNSTSSPPGQAKSSESHSLGGGTLAGVVIGAVAVFACVSAIVLCVRRKRHTKPIILQEQLYDRATAWRSYPEDETQFTRSHELPLPSPRELHGVPNAKARFKWSGQSSIYELGSE